MDRIDAGAEAADLKSRFVYQDDGRIDSFRILDGLGALRGDCDDVAVTMLWRVEGRVMWRFWLALATGRAAIWRCVTDTGELHAILWHRTYGWIENGTFMWTEEPAPDLILRHKRGLATIALKMLRGKVFG